ncbi:hypothetical protein HDV05_000288, partial [Chytridiales sp. JEL 0842]
MFWQYVHDHGFTISANLIQGLAQTFVAQVAIQSILWIIYFAITAILNQTNTTNLIRFNMGPLVIFDWGHVELNINFVIVTFVYPFVSAILNFLLDWAIRLFTSKSVEESLSSMLLRQATCDTIITTANMLMIFRQASLFVFTISLIFNIIAKEVFHVIALVLARNHEVMKLKQMVNPETIKNYIKASSIMLNANLSSNAELTDRQSDSLHDTGISRNSTDAQTVHNPGAMDKISDSYDDHGKIEIPSNQDLLRPPNNAHIGGNSRGSLTIPAVKVEILHARVEQGPKNKATFMDISSLSLSEKICCQIIMSHYSSWI